MQRALQDQKRTRPGRQRWGSCCTRRYEGGKWKAVISDVDFTAYLFLSLLLFDGAPSSKLLDTDPKSASLLDFLLLTVQPETVTGRERRVAARSRGRSQIILVKCDRQRRVCRKNELCVALAPVPESGQCASYNLGSGDLLDASNVDGSGRCSCCHFLIASECRLLACSPELKRCLVQQ